MMALIVALALTVPLIVLLMWALVALYRETQRTRISTGEAVSHALAQAALSHAAQIESLHLFYRESLTQVGNTVQFGTPHPPEAVIDREPTPEQSLGRAIEEDTINRGMESLRREYEAAGIRITEDELRNEVIQIVTGILPEEPASVRGLIDRAPVG